MASIKQALRGEVLVHEELGSNIAMDRQMKFGDVDKAFDTADHVVKFDFKFPRHTAMPLEPYGVIAWWTGNLVHVVANAQGPLLYILRRPRAWPFHETDRF